MREISSTVCRPSDSGCGMSFISFTPGGRFLLYHEWLQMPCGATPSIDEYTALEVDRSQYEIEPVQHLLQWTSSWVDPVTICYHNSNRLFSVTCTSTIRTAALLLLDHQVLLPVVTPALRLTRAHLY
eukprot:GHUV01010258.1.p1 GENE.GHUV01010258.1~~GHUV01010258.1.p1  ORF type:complete len:127 (+),score=8.51 GHUV01010258.1:1837-2217(+)